MLIRRALLILAFMPGLAVCSGGGPSNPTPPISYPGVCNLKPNFILQVRLNRWRNFPLHYLIIETGFPTDKREWLQQYIINGVSSWATESNGTIGSIIPVSHVNEADFLILAENLENIGAHTTHSTGTPFLRDGRIVFNIGTLERLYDSDDSILLSALAAHEMGHLLGIIGHSSEPNTLMRIPLQAPKPTPTDINTLSHAYCDR